MLDKLLHSSAFLITDLAVRYPNNSLKKLGERQRREKLILLLPTDQDEEPNNLHLMVQTNRKLTHYEVHSEI